MELFASGRDSDVFAYADGLVLRRYRDGRPAEGEAATLRAVATLGYPVPAVHGARGPDIVMVSGREALPGTPRTPGPGLAPSGPARAPSRASRRPA